MYSTCCSVESAGYCDRSFLTGSVGPSLWEGVLSEEDVEVVLAELRAEATLCGIRGTLPTTAPFLRDVLEGTLVDGNDERDACRLMVPLALPVVPLVDGRYASVFAMTRMTAYPLV